MKRKNPAAVALGRITSEAKAKAARENGKLGGRPRKLGESVNSFGEPIEEDVLVEMDAVITEMANVTSKYHRLGIDIKFHVQQPGDRLPHRLPPHFANTKVFRGDFKATDMKFTVSVPDLRITDGDTSWLSAKEKKEVLGFIKRNADNFIALFKDQGLGVDELDWK